MKLPSPTLALAASLVLAIATASIAQTTTTTTSAPSGGALAIVVTAVQGAAQYRASGETKWSIVKEGQQLTEGTELRTGTKGAVQFKVLPDQVYRVDRLTAVRILRANLENGVIKTDVGMTYGHVSKDLDAPSRPHDDKIVSPSSTLAIRGTRVSLFDQPPYPAEAVSLTGTAVFQTFKRQAVAFGSKGGGTAAVTSDVPSAANNSLYKTVVDPATAFSGRTQEEQFQLLSLTAYGGKGFSNLGVFSLLGRSEAGNLQQSVIGTPPVGEQLLFQMIWNGSPFSDVNLTVVSPRGEIVSNANPVVPSSGSHSPNGVADASGFGQESATWVISFPQGQYQIQEHLKAGANAQTQVLVIRDPEGLFKGPTTLGQFSDSLTPRQPTAVHQVNVTSSSGVAAGMARPGRY